MADQIVVLKVSTGEEIVGRLAEKSDEQMMLEKVRSLVMVPGPNPGEVGVQLIPFMTSNVDGKLGISISHIVATSAAEDNLERMYLQQTSGIDLSTSMTG